MSSVGKDRGARETRERSRVYQARQAFHQGQTRRRTRDNLIAGIGGGLVIVAIVVVQTLYFTVGPGTPVPEPEPTSITTPPALPSSVPDPVDSESPVPEPVDTELPEPEPTSTP
ncbi:dioxygenase [Microbacterium sp. NPDC055910]|uniref:dioxygenase n=1 Tax=Microbacterium sp. NPDC055910 TaxID=3345659 RepID=UPI0035DBEC7F